jgi:hypothetical protein
VQWLCKMLPLFEVLLLPLIGFFQSCPISVTPIQGCWHMILWTDQLEGHSSLWTTGRAGTKCLDPISLCYACPQVLGLYVTIWLLLRLVCIAHFLCSSFWNYITIWAKSTHWRAW